MFDPAQTALFLVIIVLAILLLVLGIQVLFILKEFRKTVSKANKILDDTGIISESVSAPISSLSALVTSVKAGARVAKFLRKKKILEDE
jgi:hypothetical protein